jgi:hypothetical protein
MKSIALHIGNGLVGFFSAGADQNPTHEDYDDRNF